MLMRLQVNLLYLTNQLNVYLFRLKEINGAEKLFFALKIKQITNIVWKKIATKFVVELVTYKISEIAVSGVRKKWERCKKSVITLSRGH